MKSTIATLGLVLIAALPVAAQKKPSPLQPSVNSVQDRRSSGSFAELNIEVKLDGLSAKDLFAAKVKLLKAVDDTGGDLLDAERDEPRFVNTIGATPYVQDDQAATIGLALRNPGRDATLLKELRAELELFIPSRDKDATALIPKFRSSEGKPIANKALKANGVEITLVTAAQIEAEKKKVVDAKRKEAKESGADEETIEYLVSMAAENFLTVSEGEIVARVKDPNNRIHEMAFVPPSGEPARLFTEQRDGFTILSTYGEAPAADAALRVTLRTPKAIQKVPLELKDVELP